MNNKLLKTISLSIVSVLGLGGLVGVTSLRKEAVSAQAVPYTEKNVSISPSNPNNQKTTMTDSTNVTWSASIASKHSVGCTWQDTPASSTFTLTRSQSISHIYKIYVDANTSNNSYSSNPGPADYGEEAKYMSVNVKVYIGNTLVAQDTSPSASNNMHFFNLKNIELSSEMNGVPRLVISSASNSQHYYSFAFWRYTIYYHEYNAIAVTLDHNGGTSSQDTVDCTFDEAMPTVAIPTRPGYRFDGYYNGTKQYFKGDGTPAISKFDINADSFALTAKWTLMEFSVELNDNYPTGTTEYISAIYTETMPTLSSIPLRGGYDFLGYFDAQTGGNQYYDAQGKAYNDKKYDLTSNTTLYAHWQFDGEELMDIIDSIGEVTYPGSHDTLRDVEFTYYNTLDELDREAFASDHPEYVKKLEDARIEYDSQKDAAVQAVKDAIQVIADLGDFTYPSEEAKEAIKEARELYNALHSDEKNTFPSNIYAILTGAETSYENQKNEKVAEVIAAIDAIEEPFGENRETQISNARTLYEALDSDEKNVGTITNYSVLVDAEAADVVATMIEAPNPADTEEYRNAVKEARDAYTALSDSQKAFINADLLKILVDDEQSIIVMDLIHDIGEVSYTQESKQLIVTANNAYEALSDDQKALVLNYSTLVKDNTDYDAVDEAVNKINAIGLVEYTTESKALIDDAKDYYDNLTDEQKEILPDTY